MTGLGFLEGGGSLATGLDLLTIPISREKAFDLLENDAELLHSPSVNKLLTLQ